MLNSSPNSLTIFLCSTFGDFRAEREHLDKAVFDPLRMHCEEQGIEFEVIDPCRGKDREEDVDNAETLLRNLTQIDRCRPVFIGLLGERSGKLWDGIPEEIASAFPHFRALGQSSRTALEIIHGTLQERARSSAIGIFLRSPSFLDQVSDSHRKHFETEGAESDVVLRQLQERIRKARLPVFEYRVRWDPEYEHLTGLDDFVELVRGFFRDHVVHEYPGLASVFASSPEPRSGADRDAVEPVVQRSSAGTESLGTEPERPVNDENVQFTVYRPKAIQPETWCPLLVFAHLSERAKDAPEDELDPIEEVQRQAAQVLGARAKGYQDTTQDSQQAVPREGEITFVPEISGVEFNPPRRTFRWVESVHREEFRLRASPESDGKTARGRLTVFLGSIILAEVSLAIKVDRRHQPANAEEVSKAEHARPYRKIFASYSHQDLTIVRQFEWFARTLGDEYLRDWVHLRAGELWNERLLRLIDEADVFQLFWSSNAMASRYVRQEWEYALSLGRPHFIRPTYWEDPLPQAPEEDLPPETLRRLHFQLLPLASPSASLASTTHRDLSPAPTTETGGADDRGYEAAPLTKPSASDVTAGDPGFSGINLSRPSDSGINLQMAAGMGLSPGASSIELAPLSGDDLKPEPKSAAKPSAKPSPGDRPPPVARKEKDIIDDTEFELDVLDSEGDSDDKTAEREAASDFDLEESDAGSEVFALDEDAVDDTATTAMGPTVLDEHEEDAFESAHSDEMASSWDVESERGAPAARSYSRESMSPRHSAGDGGPSTVFMVVAVAITVILILAFGYFLLSQ